MRELRERAGQIVKVLCLLLAAIVVYQLAGVILRWNPFRGVTVPELPVLTAAANGPAEGPQQPNPVAATAGKGTNNPSRPPATNSSLPVAGIKTNSVTNSIASATPAEKGTTSVALAESPLTGTNGSINSAPNTVTNTATTNTTPLVAAKASPPLRESATNAATNVVAQADLKAGGSNTVPALLSTNQGTNLVGSVAGTETNAAAARSKKRQTGGAPMPGMAGMGSGPAQKSGKPGPALPPAVQARIQQVTESELLAPVMHPLPMGLLGIAGEVAFLRSANGQTGVVKEGDSLDDLKLLRIGINRVLIEQDGQKKELMIFSGYGGDSLLPKDSTNETNHP